MNIAYLVGSLSPRKVRVYKGSTLLIATDKEYFYDNNNGNDTYKYYRFTNDGKILEVYL